MSRLISLLLIPLIVLGQGLPHAHAEDGMCVPSDHGSRPHIHWDLGHHHDCHDHDDCGEHGPESTNDHEDPDLASSPPSDHDSTAIYLASGTFCLVRVDDSPDLGSLIVYTLAASPLVTDGLHWSSTHAPRAAPNRLAKLPIYLAIASLRL